MGKKTPRKGRISAYRELQRGKNISVVAGSDVHADIDYVSEKTGVTKSSLMLHGYRKMRGMSINVDVDQELETCRKAKKS